jgi:splicing factor 3B subunit 1
MKTLLLHDLNAFKIATAAISHMTIGVTGFGCEDALNHLLNFIWPNIFENSPHVCQAVHACLEGMRISLGPIRVFQYAVQVTPITFDKSLYS